MIEIMAENMDREGGWELRVTVKLNKLYLKDFD